MIKFINNLQNLRTKKQKAKSYKLSRGMTYVEIIVVLSIFGILSATVMYSYTEFQAKVDIKNLASDIASKIVEAQKSAVNGVLPLSLIGTGSYDDTWKPSYGVYFNTSSDDLEKQFIYFVDLGTESDPQDKVYKGLPSCDTTECLDRITFSKGEYIEAIDECNDLVDVDCDPGTSPLADSELSITFTRPDSSAVFSSGTMGSNYVQITVQSPRSDLTSKIKVYPSGRVQVN